MGALADNEYLMRPTGKWRELVFEGSQNRVGRETECWRWKRDRIAVEGSWSRVVGSLVGVRESVGFPPKNVNKYTECKGKGGVRDKTREDTILARPGDKGLTGALADNGYLMRPTDKWRELVFEGIQNRVGRETEWRWKRDRITWE
eukprot:scaffold48653_cov22-Cyclotella_meneghiniana.AAC.1